jgi:eukaryotic-like serine/threonine-protein kinase
MIGQRLGSFLIEAKIGSGAMGVVYRATNEKTGKIAAVKVVTAEAGAKAGTNKRFQREADILQQFRHPNIVRFLAVGRYSGTSYFAMEFVKGSTLDVIVERRGAMDWREVVRLGIQICDALQYAHDRGVVHRDLKPSNLLVTEQGQIKLTDFGIAKDLDATALTATGRTLGTAAYMAPEQIRGTPEVSHKTDLYALGCLLFQMLTGQPPFQGKAVAVLMNMHINLAPPRPSEKAGDIPIAIENLIVGPEMDESGTISKRSRGDKIGLILDSRNRPLFLMAKDPTLRPHDAQAVGEILRTLQKIADRNETLPMVFGGDGNPTRLGSMPVTWAATVDSSTAGATSAATQSKKSKRATKKRPLESLLSAHPEWIAPAGLVSALIACVLLFAYLAWPPSAKYLMEQAKAQMASKEFGQWKLAQSEYFDTIEQKVPDPNHPFRLQVQEWRDKIALEGARRRADILEKPNMGKVARPNPDLRGEMNFAEAYLLSLAALDKGKDEAAARYWDSMAQALRQEDKDERPWVLLAKERAAKIRKDLITDQMRLTNLLQEADKIERNGGLDQAQEVRRGAIKDYGARDDLRRVFLEFGIEPSKVDAVPSSPPDESKP